MATLSQRILLGGSFFKKKIASRDQKSKHIKTAFTGRETAVPGSKHAKHSKTLGQGSFRGCLSPELSELIFVSVSDQGYTRKLASTTLAAPATSKVLLLQWQGT